MGMLIYATITSLDGYIEDTAGSFDWAAPDEEVHTFVNNLERSIGTYLYGRRLYEVMLFWETAHADARLTDVERDFADIWQRADKIVYSKSLKTASSARTVIDQAFDAETVRRLKSTSTSDITIGGADLAAHAIRAGLIDEYQQFLSPIVVGGGWRALPDDVRIDLDLIDERRFGNGVVFLRYRTRR